MIKVCIFGAGSIGGYLAACLSKNNIDLSLIARGPHKKAIQENGLTLIKNDKSFNFRAIHINHNNSSNAKEMEKLCGDICHEYNINLTIKNLSLIHI